MYNSSKHIQEYLESLINQTYKDYVINDDIYCGNDFMKLVNAFNIEKIINVDALSRKILYIFSNRVNLIQGLFCKLIKNLLSNI